MLGRQQQTILEDVAVGLVGILGLVVGFFFGWFILLAWALGWAARKFAR